MIAAPRARTAAALLGTAALGGLLAGCAAGGAATDAAGPAGSGGSGNSGSGSTSDAPYADGTYSASGSYVSPHGPESIDVTLTLVDDIVESIEVIGHGDNPDSQHFQGFFVDGIAAEVVGKDIDSLNVSKVGGSSLTSGGFAQALAEIKAEAAA